MKSSSISVSNAMVLSPREWLAAVAISAVIVSTVYFGWGSWERYEPGPDHRETCWAELQSDYWAYMRWIRYARDNYDILLLGDSVVWGQEVSNDRTISHYVNEMLGGEKVANVGNDGLFMAGINGAVRYYGDYLNDTNVIVQCNPLWFDDLGRDLRGEKKSRYHHPRLIPQFDPRITYYHDLNTRLGYQIEHYFRVFPLVRHLMANYFDNTSIANWMNDHPYENPFSAITFKSSEVMAEKQGRGVDWETNEMEMADKPFMELDESIQLELFLNALYRIRQKQSRVFVLIGPYNQHHLVPSSRAILFERMTELKQILDDRGYLYYDTFSAGLPSNTFADNCHLLAEGHEIVARALVGDPSFQKWLTEAQ